MIGSDGSKAGQDGILRWIQGAVQERMVVSAEAAAQERDPNIGTLVGMFFVHSFVVHAINGSAAEREGARST